MPAPAVIVGAIGLFEKMIGLGAEMIEDKDKKNEYIFKNTELMYQMFGELLQTKTVPWVDAMVKIMIAGKAFVRPIGGALMTAFGAYAHWKGIDIPPAMHAIFDGALPAWGVSRHTEKKEKIRAAEVATAKKSEPLPEAFWDD